MSDHYTKEQRAAYNKAYNERKKLARRPFIPMRVKRRLLPGEFVELDGKLYEVARPTTLLEVKNGKAL